jgi:hypothetical protein
VRDPKGNRVELQTWSSNQRTGLSFMRRSRLTTELAQTGHMTAIRFAYLASSKVTLPNRRIVLLATPLIRRYQSALATDSPLKEREPTRTTGADRSFKGLK